MMMRMMMSLISHFLFNVTLSNSATGTTIKKNTRDLVMKVREQMMMKVMTKRVMGMIRMIINDTYKSVPSQSVIIM